LREKLTLLAAVLMMVVWITVPAVAQVAPAATQIILYVPSQNVDNFTVPDPGGTLSCSGAPFTAPSGTCTSLGAGPPGAGLVCDVPTTVLAFEVVRLSAFECHAPDTASGPVDIENVSPGNRQFVITDDPNSFNSVRFR
jgi:hypothetical protein